MVVLIGVSHLHPYTIALKLEFIGSDIFYIFLKVKLSNGLKSYWQDRQHSHMPFPEETRLSSNHTHTSFCKSDFSRYLEKQRK